MSHWQWYWLPRLTFAAVVAGWAFPPPIPAGENWPSFQNGGILSFAEDTSPGNASVAWTAEIPGYGQSSPVVWKGTIYVTSVSGPKKESYHISAYRQSDGKKLWQHDVSNASPQENSNYVSKAAPTPAADDNGVICFFEGGNVVALTHGGAVRWDRDLVKDYGPIDARHGLGASIEQTKNFVFLWVERKTDPYVLALDKQNGEAVWKVPGLGVTSWSSPRLIPVDERKHLVLSGIGKIAGLDPENGRRLWTFDEISGNSTPTPVPLGKARFLIGATAGRGEASAGRAAESNGVIAIRRSDDGTWAADYVWKAKRATSSFGSPVHHKGNVYFVNRTGVVYCLDAETGREQYVERIGHSIWATPIACAETIWLFGKDGVVTTLQAGHTFRSTGQVNLFSEDEPERDSESSPPAPHSTLYAGVLAGDVFLLRSGDRLFCLQK